MEQKSRSDKLVEERALIGPIQKLLKGQNLNAAGIHSVVLRTLFWTALTLSLTYMVGGALLWGFHVDPMQIATLMPTYLPIFLYGMAGILAVALGVAIYRSEFFQRLWGEAQEKDEDNPKSAFLRLAKTAIWEGTFRRSHKEKWVFLAIIIGLIITAALVHKGVISIMQAPFSVLLMPLVAFSAFIILAFLYNLRPHLTNRSGIATDKLYPKTNSLLIILVGSIVLGIGIWAVKPDFYSVSPNAFQGFEIMLTFLGAGFFIGLLVYAGYLYRSDEFKQKRELVDVMFVNAKNKTIIQMASNLDCLKGKSGKELIAMALKNEKRQYAFIPKPASQIQVEEAVGKLEVNEDDDEEDDNDKWKKDIPDQPVTLCIELTNSGKEEAVEL